MPASNRIGEAVGERAAQKPAAQPRFIPGTGSPRNPIPEAVVAILNLLLEQLEDVPSETRVELRNIRSRLCRVYKLPTVASATELAWEEHDGEIPE